MANYKGAFAFDEEKYQVYLKEAREKLFLEFSNLLSMVDDLRLSEKIIYALQTRGKLLRPILVLLSGQSVGGNREYLKKLALSIELLHNATLVHDDILDNDNFRRGWLHFRLIYLLSMTMKSVKLFLRHASHFVMENTWTQQR